MKGNGQKMKELILASSSPRRKEILSHIGLDFKVIIADADEENDLPNDVRTLVMTLAERKAAIVAENHKDSIVIGSDTVVSFEDKVLTKPRSEAEAREMLKRLSGNTHSVFSGLCVISGEKKICRCDETRVFMKPLDKDEIDRYVATGEPMDKAGAYGAQDLGGVFVERIEGDHYNVVGLPLAMLYNILKDEFDFSLLEAAKR